MNTTNKRKSTTKGRKRVRFEVKAKPGSDVFLSGSFNDWDKEAKRMIDKEGAGNYSATLFLPPGTHEYKFVINGVWQSDPRCPSWVANEHGTLNSVVMIDAPAG